MWRCYVARGGGGAPISLDDQISSLGQLGGGRSILPPAAFAEDASGGREECIQPRAALKTAAAPAEAGGGALLCDAATAAAIGGWAEAQPEKAARLKALRGALAAAKATVGAAVPRLQRAVDTVVKDGYDDSHHGYLGFCMEKVVVINLAPLMARAARRPLPRKIVDELMYTVTQIGRASCRERVLPTV